MENKCHDCQKEMVIEGDEIKGGFLLEYDGGIKVFKCESCYEKSPALTNYKECEVYTRIVGYHGPVKQFNVGKKKEYEDRSEYRLEE